MSAGAEAQTELRRCVLAHEPAKRQSAADVSTIQSCARSSALRGRMPNEKEMSDGGRGRASLGLKVWKSSQKVEGTTVRRSLHRMVRSLWVYWRAVAQRSERSSITSSSPSSDISSRASWNQIGRASCRERV